MDTTTLLIILIVVLIFSVAAGTEGAAGSKVPEGLTLKFGSALLFGALSQPRTKPRAMLRSYSG